MHPILRNRVAKVLGQASTALAWGAPDHECIGYSSSDFMSVIRAQQALIKELAFELEKNSEPYVSDDI
jgi:hypothetical protein